MITDPPERRDDEMDNNRGSKKKGVRGEGDITIGDRAELTTLVGISWKLFCVDIGP